MKIFIGNLSPDTTKKELKDIFSKFGNVSESDVIKNYGFVVSILWGDSTL